jgi:hypothetical protein
MGCLHSASLEGHFSGDIALETVLLYLLKYRKQLAQTRADQKLPNNEINNRKTQQHRLHTRQLGKERNSEEKVHRIEQKATDSSKNSQRVNTWFPINVK